MANKSITERQQYWQNHIRAADTGNTSIVAYAKRQGLNVKDLYQWKTKLIKMGFYKAVETVPAFVPVKASAPTLLPELSKSSQCALKFPNGLRLEFQGSVLPDVIRTIVETTSIAD